jgi:hypothetical protein
LYLIVDQQYRFHPVDLGIYLLKWGENWETPNFHQLQAWQGSGVSNDRYSQLNSYLWKEFTQIAVVRMHSPRQSRKTTSAWRIFLDGVYPFSMCMWRYILWFVQSSNACWCHPFPYSLPVKAIFPLISHIFTLCAAWIPWLQFCWIIWVWINTY